MRFTSTVTFGTFAQIMLLPFMQGCGSDDPSPYELATSTRGRPLTVNVSEFREPTPVAEYLEEDEDGRVVPVVLTAEQAIVSGTEPISQQERAEWRALRAESIDPSPPQPESPTTTALEYAASRPADELIPIVVLLEDPGFDFRRFGMLKSVTDQDERDSLRAELIAEREAQLREANQSVAVERLVALGADVTRVLWITNSLSADIPAGALPEIAQWPELDRLYYEDPALKPHPESSGLEIRSETLVSNFHAAGYTGADGNDGTTTAVKIAVVEADGTANWLNRDHDGFDDTAGGATRVTFLWDCTGTCAATTNVNTVGHTHATRVAWTVAGSIEEGQDNSYPGTSTNDQRDRSGIATESSIQVYYTDGWADVTAAMQAALAHDADIITLSLGSAAAECQDMAAPESYDQSNLNMALRVAMNANVLVVKSSGNYHNQGDTCSAGYPAWRPHVLSAGAVYTPTSTTLDDAFLWYENGPSTPDGEGVTNDEWGSGRGRVPYIYDGNRVLDSVPTVGLVAPGTIENYFSSNSSYSGTSQTGTSYATPMVAGGAALLKHAFLNVSVPTWSTDVKRFIPNMLLMGNGWWVNGNDDWGLEMGTSNQFASRASGFGKLRMHYPYDSTMGTSRRWMTSAVNVTHGGAFQAIKVNPNSSGVNQVLPNTVTQLKWQAAWFADELTDNGSIGVEVFDAACTSTTPWTGTHLAHDWTGNGRSRIQLTGASVQGKCIFLVLKPYFTPGAATTTVYNAFYWHSGSTGVH